MLYTYAKQITGLRKEAEQALDHFLGRSWSPHSGRQYHPREYILPPLLGKFKEHYPAIKIHLCIGDTEEIVEELLSRKIETGIIGAKISNSRLQFTPFVEDELILVVPRGHRWWNKTATINELADEPFVMREAGSGTRISMEKRLAEYGIATDSLNVITEMGSTTAVKQAIRQSLDFLFTKRAVDE